MLQQMARTLGLRQIHALIDAPGEFLAEVKSRELKRFDRKASELRDHYTQVGRLLDTLREEDSARRQLRDLFSHIPRLALPSKRAELPLALHELFLIKEFLYHYHNLREFIRGKGWMDLLILPDTSELFAMLDPDGSGQPSFRISPAYSPKLGEIISARLELAHKLKYARGQLLAEAKRELELPQLKDEFTLSRGQAELTERVLRSPYFILSSESIANYSFTLADDEHCLELKKRLSSLEAKREKEEERILKDLSRKIIAALPLLHEALELAGQGGWRFLLADFALSYGCCIPTLHRKKQIRIKSAVNLPLKLHLEERGRRYQELDYNFDQPVSLITGPNMGGKTTILKTLGQLCGLARQGIPLPCAKAELPLFDHIWYNQDESGSADLSSFGREVVSFVETLELEGNTLFLLDEFAKGTNPTEGELLASAVLRHLASTGKFCIAATHFTAPAMLEGLPQYSIAGLDNKAEALQKGLGLSPAQRLKSLSEAMDYRLRRLEKHEAPPLSAIQVARILGMPEAILQLTRKDIK